MFSKLKILIRQRSTRRRRPRNQASTYFLKPFLITTIVKFIWVSIITRRNERPFTFPCLLTESRSRKRSVCWGTQCLSGFLSSFFISIHFALTCIYSFLVAWDLWFCKTSSLAASSEVWLILCYSDIGLTHFTQINVCELQHTQSWFDNWVLTIREALLNWIDPVLIRRQKVCFYVAPMLNIPSCSTYSMLVSGACFR